MLVHYGALRSLNRENSLPVKFKMADGPNFQPRPITQLQIVRLRSDLVQNFIT